MLCNNFLKTPLDDFWQLLNLFWPEPCRVVPICGSKIKDIKKKYSENFIEYFSRSKN